MWHRDFYIFNDLIEGVYDKFDLHFGATLTA